MAEPWYTNTILAIPVDIPFGGWCAVSAVAIAGIYFWYRCELSRPAAAVPYVTIDKKEESAKIEIADW